MPTHNDETLHDRYTREHLTHLARLATMTPDQIAAMELDLHNALAEVDRLRARLPSQGDEAVAWAICKEPGRVDWLSATYANKRAAEAHVASYKNDLTLYIAPLYTHPADQVADDLTMVKASRELLQDLRDLAFDQVEHHRAAMGAYKQTRQSAMDSVLAQADALLEVKS